MSSKTAVIDIEKAILEEEDYKKASKDLAVRLVSISQTLRKVAGGSLGAIGTTAGRVAATHLPRMFEEETTGFEDILKDLKEKWKDSFKFDYTVSGESATLTFDNCPVYEFLSLQGEKVGGDLCTLFHTYLQGIIGEVINRKAQIKPESTGAKCVLTVRLMPKFD